jgi:hypothetical protein
VLVPDAGADFGSAQPLPLPFRPRHVSELERAELELIGKVRQRVLAVQARERVSFPHHFEIRAADAPQRVPEPLALPGRFELAHLHHVDSRRQHRPAEPARAV